MSDFREFWKNPNRKDGLTVCRASLHTTIVELEYIAVLLIEWLDTQDAVTAESFYLSKNIPSRTWEDWLKRCPDLQDAWDIAVERIGERREVKGLKGEYNPGLVERTMPLYNKKYRALRKEMSNKADSTGSGQTVIVLRDKMPETDMVKERVYEGTE
jgi:hypothetical protein